MAVSVYLPQQVTGVTSVLLEPSMGPGLPMKLDQAAMMEAASLRTELMRDLY